MTKRRIALFLAMCMLFSVFSTVAYADNSITLTGDELDDFLDMENVESDTSLKDELEAFEDDIKDEILKVDNAKTDIVGASSGACGASLTWTLDDEGTLTISGTGEMKDYGQTSNKAPWGTDIKNVVVEKGVTSVGDYAFYDCTSLTSVTIPDSVTLIDYCAFYNCESLTSATIPDSVTSIGGYVFYGCTSLTSVTIPDSVTSIGDSAFYGCTNPKSVYYTGDITGWLEISFEGYDSNPMYYGKEFYLNGELITELVIPDSVVSIGDYTFCGFISLTSVTIPDSVTSIGDYAFYGCTSLASVTIPDSVTSIGYSAFYNCTSLASVTIGNSVTSIGGWAFSYCKSLMSVTIPDSVTSIGYSAFSSCTSLASITIPDSVTSIGDSAFSSCTSLASITIPDSVVSIGDSAFSYCKSLMSVTIPDSVTSIGSLAFFYCTSLTSVTIPDSVTSIGYYAFLDTALYEDETNWENDVLYIGKYLIKADDAITSCEIKEGTKIIADSAFSSCTSLASVTIPDSVTSIGYRAFYNCTSLASVTIPDSVTSIGEEAFLDTALYEDETNWENDVLYTGKYFISAKETITSCEIKEGTMLIADYAFENCKNLSSVTIPNSVINIGEYAFYNCEKLKSVTIPGSVAYIGEYALGYYYHYYEIAKVTDFIIYGGINTAANTYATENDMFFWDINKGASGTCGEKLTWILDIDGNLKITGSGEMTGSPWNVYNNICAIKSVTIEKGVTSIESGVFSKTAYYNDETNWENGVLYIGNYLIKANSKVISGEYEIKNGTTVIANDAFYNCDISSIIIPDSVKSISRGAFSECAYLESVTIGENITSICDKAFFGCDYLDYVTIGSNVETIGNYVFGDCWYLQAITVSEKNQSFSSENGILFTKDKKTLICYPAGKNDKLYVIPDRVIAIKDGAFGRCRSLEFISIPNSVTNIGDSAFKECTSLASVTIPKSVTSIGLDAFHEEILICGKNDSYAETYAIENDYQFWNEVDEVSGVCGGNITWTLDAEGILTISGTGEMKNFGYPTYNGPWAPYKNYITSVRVADGVTTIGAYAFDGYEKITSVTIGNSVTSIGSNAFYGCSGITSITIPDSVTSIGVYAFYDCTSLSTVKIGKNVSYIDVSVFRNCTSLKMINVSEDNQKFYSENGVLFNKNKTQIVLYPAAKEDKTYVIPESITDIKTYAFYGCTNLQSITLPETVKNIGASSFGECTGLTSVTIPDSITTIDVATFDGCSNLSSLIIGKNVKTIENYAFSNCSNISSLTIPNSVTNIYDQAFLNCEKLTSVTIPESVTYIGYDVFGYYYYYDWEDNNSKYGKIEGFTIIGVNGSEAETYANDEGFIFVEITQMPEADSDVYIDTYKKIMPNIVAKTEVSTIVGALSEYGISATITGKDGKALVETAKVGTGCKVTDSNGNTYTVIVKGDVDGTGEINSTDYLQIKKMFLGSLSLENEYFTAADTDGDGSITSTDYLQIKKYFLGQLDLYA